MGWICVGAVEKLVIMKKHLILLSFFLIHFAQAQQSLDSLRLVLPVGQKNLAMSGKFNSKYTRFYLLTHANEIIIYDVKSCREVKRVSLVKTGFEIGEIGVQYFEINKLENRLIVSGHLTTDGSNAVMMVDLIQEKIINTTFIEGSENEILGIEYTSLSSEMSRNFFILYFKDRIRYIDELNGEIIETINYHKSNFVTKFLDDSFIYVISKEKNSLFLESISLVNKNKINNVQEFKVENINTAFHSILLRNNLLVVFTKNGELLKYHKGSIIDKLTLPTNCVIQDVLYDDPNCKIRKEHYTAVLDSCGTLNIIDLINFKIIYSLKINLESYYDPLYFSFSDKFFILIHKSKKYIFKFESKSLKIYNFTLDSQSNSSYLLDINQIGKNHILVKKDLDDPFEGGIFSNWNINSNKQINESKNLVNSLSSINYCESKNILSYSFTNSMLDSNNIIVDLELNKFSRIVNQEFLKKIDNKLGSLGHQKQSIDEYFKSDDGNIEYYITNNNQEKEFIFVRDINSLFDTVLEFNGQDDDAIIHSDDKLLFAYFKRNKFFIFNSGERKNIIEMDLSFIDGYNENPRDYSKFINWESKNIIVYNKFFWNSSDSIFIIDFNMVNKSFKPKNKPDLFTKMIYDSMSNSIIYIDEKYHLNIIDIDSNVDKCPPTLSNKKSFDFILNGNELRIVTDEELVIINFDNLKEKRQILFSSVLPDMRTILSNEKSSYFVITTTDMSNDAYDWPNFDSRIYYNDSYREVYKTEDYAGFITDNNVLISYSDDKGINFTNLKTGKGIFKWYEFKNNNWLVKLPNSPYYMCSKDASKMLHYVTPSLKVIGFEQLDPVYNRPDIVLDSIGKYFGNSDGGMIEEYRKSWEKRIDRLGLDKEKLGKGEIAVPNAEILEADAIAYENKNGKLDIEVAANDPKYPLRRFNVYVNEVPLYGSAGISIAHLKKQVWDTTVSVLLSVGENKIQVSVMNELGLENFKYPTYVNYTPLEPIVAKTYYIGIGVNEFKEPGHKLNYCVKDVTDLSTSFGGPNTEVKLFTNAQVTKENILALKDYLAKTTVNDKVIISCSSHGLLDDSLNFYLAMHDVDFNNPKARGLKYEELENLLDSIPARQKLLLLDACNSGENDKTDVFKNELANNHNNMDSTQILAARGVIIKLEDENKSNFKKMNELFVNVRNNTGSVIISAAGGQESALEAITLEGKSIENGAFSYCVLEYLQNNSNNPEELTVNKLKNYVEKRVEEITNGKQQPTSRQETMEVDWSVK